MAELVDVLRGQLSPEELTELQAAVAQHLYDSNRQDISAAADVSLTEKTSLFSVTGTVAYGLPDGVEGQVKVLVCVAAASTPDGVVTPDNFGNGSTITLDAAGETISLIFSNATWWMTALDGATIA